MNGRDVLAIMRGFREDINPDISLIRRFNNNDIIKASLRQEHNVDIPCDLFTRKATICEDFLRGIVVNYGDYSLVCGYNNSIRYNTKYVSYFNNTICADQPNGGARYSHNGCVSHLLEIINKTFRAIHYEEEIKEC